MEKFIYYDFENFRLDVVNEQLLKDNQPIPLTHKAFKTLLILVQNFGQLVKKEDIITEIWRDSFVEDANLTQHIYVLRKTLGNNKDGKPFIETIPKRGYSFVGEIKKIVAPPVSVREAFYTPHLRSEDAVLNEQFIYISDVDGRIHYSGDLHNSDEANKPIVIPNHSAKETKRSNLLSPLWIILVLIGVLGVSLFLYQRLQPVKSSEIKSIAVLPFRPIGTENNTDKIGFGLADAVITSLSKLQNLPVRQTSAVFQYTEKTFDPVVAGKELGVDSVLDGTVQREGEWVRVSVRLIKIDDGTTLWAETFDEKFTYIFALQDSISTKVAKSLIFNLSNAQEQQLIIRNTSNPAAYEAYQLGIYFWNRRSKDGLEKAVEYFQKAIEQDSSYALAYAMLADSHNMLVYYGYANNYNESMIKADEAAKKALLLNESLPEAHIAMSYVQLIKYEDTNAGIRSLERAIELSPYNSTARIRYGWQLLRQRKLEETHEQMRIAQENDPLSPISNSALCTTFLFKRNYAEALKYCEKSVEIQPTTPLVKVQLASAYYLNGRIEEAITLLETEIQNGKGIYTASAGLAYIYAKIGKIKEAEEIFFRLRKDVVISNRYSDLTLIAFTLGRKDEALDYFKKVIGKSYIMPTNISSDPYWEELIKDEKFSQIISQLKN